MMTEILADPMISNITEKEDMFDCKHFENIPMSIIDSVKLSALKSNKKCDEDRAKFSLVPSSNRTQSVHVDNFGNSNNSIT